MSELQKLHKQKQDAARAYGEISERIHKKKNMNSHHWDARVSIEKDIRKINDKILTEARNKLKW